MTGTAFLCCLPMLIWNALHNWVTFRHVAGQAGAHEPFHWFGPLEFAAVQGALLLGFWFAAWFAALYERRPSKEPDPGLRYLWCMSLPMFMVFFVFGFKTGGGEPNWPITAYVSGLLLAVDWQLRQLASHSPRYRRLAQGALVAACGLGLGLIALMHYTVRVQPLLAYLSGPATPSRPMPLRRFDPTCRLRGWQFLANQVDLIRARLRQEGIEPILAGHSWSLPGELGFYCDGHPPVYSIGLALGDRWSQYDFWRPNPIHDPATFQGQTFICVGWFDAVLREAFEHVEPPLDVYYRENGALISCWNVTICRGFHGFPRLPKAGNKF
jgi:hypothetical protein